MNRVDFPFQRGRILNCKTLIGAMILVSLWQLPVAYSQDEDPFLDDFSFEDSGSEDFIYGGSDSFEILPPDDEADPLESIPEPTVSETPPPPPTISDESYSTSTDEPNLEMEARFHRIYQNYRKEPIAEEEWSRVVTAGQSESYEIQSGDTLWDISRTFFGDPEYWPKIWSLNHTITNPHLVVPGYHVHFTPGGLHQIPQLTISDEEALRPPPTANKNPDEPTLVDMSELNLAEVEIPPPSRPSNGGPSPIPATFPRYSYLPPRPPESEVTIDGYIRKPQIPTVPVPSIVTNADLGVIGKFVGTESGSDVVATFESGFVKVDTAVNRGERLLVIQPRGEVYGAVTSSGPRQKVNQYQIQGELIVGEIVNQPERIYRANIVRAISAITTGAVLVRHPMPEIRMSSDGAMSNVEGYIIGGELNELREFYGESSFVFINRGRVHGLREGERVPIFFNPLTRFSKTKTIQNQRQIGVAKIAHLDSEYATAVVLEADEEIRPGDLISQNSPLVRVGKNGLYPVHLPGQSETVVEDDFALLEVDTSSTPTDSEFDFDDSEFNDLEFNDSESEELNFDEFDLDGFEF